jgi:hypothetical protein
VNVVWRNADVVHKEGNDVVLVRKSRTECNLGNDVVTVIDWIDLRGILAYWDKKLSGTKKTF